MNQKINTHRQPSILNSERIILLIILIVFLANCQSSNDNFQSDTFVTGDQNVWLKNQYVAYNPGVFSIATWSTLPGYMDRSGNKFINNEDCREILWQCQFPAFRLPGGNAMMGWQWGKPPHDNPDEFMEFVSYGNSVPVWGINITEERPNLEQGHLGVSAEDETNWLCEEIKKNNWPHTYFEFGNELYGSWVSDITTNKPAREEKPDGIEYHRISKPHLDMVKKYFPDSKASLTVGAYWSIVNTDGKFRVLGKNELSRFFLDVANDPNNDYDALVLHLYTVPTEITGGSLKGVTEDELVRWAWTRCSPEHIRDLQNLFDNWPDKEIWITEWAYNTNQYDNQYAKDDTRYFTHQTMLSALFNARYMLNVCMYAPAVTMMTYWTFVIQRSVALYNNENGKMINYYMFRLLRWARQNASYIAQLNLESGHNQAPKWNGPDQKIDLSHISTPQYDVFGFFKDAAGENLNSLVILNPSKRSHTITIPNLPDTRLYVKRLYHPNSNTLIPGYGEQKTQLESFSGKQWQAWGYNPEFKIDESEIEIDLKEKKITFPPTSMVVISTEDNYTLNSSE